MKKGALDSYRKERNALTKKEIEEILEQGRKWDLSTTLSNGGALFFPHTYIRQCGHQIAAAVHACLDSGADRIIVLGVIHALSERIDKARKKERERQDISGEPLWGCFGPGLACDPVWQEEFSLDNFLFLWDHEVKRRLVKPPELIIRYPSLANREPEKLPGIEELKAFSRNSVIIATADLLHHGAAYGHAQERIIPIGEKAYRFAEDQIIKGLALLQEQNYGAYFDHCMDTLSDSHTVGTVLSHLLGRVHGKILDLKLIDVADLFEGNPTPSWVAASLVEFRKV